LPFNLFIGGDLCPHARTLNGAALDAIVDLRYRLPYGDKIALLNQISLNDTMRKIAQIYNLRRPNNTVNHGKFRRLTLLTDSKKQHTAAD
jgi:hypothetical protein